MCHGFACADLTYSVAEQPAADSKVQATGFSLSGGGPAANAAVQLARLEHSVAFSGYLGEDALGEMQVQELHREHVSTETILRGAAPTPSATAWVKPGGARSLVHFAEIGGVFSAPSPKVFSLRPQVVLFDGHYPETIEALWDYAESINATTVLDAGSLREGTAWLAPRVDYVVASAKFARAYAETDDGEEALAQLAKVADTVVITLGGQGLLWSQNKTCGKLPAFRIRSIDTNGAGDAFHGAFCAGLVRGLPWADLLRFSSAAGALCCQRQGARQGLPREAEIQALLNAQ